MFEKRLHRACLLVIHIFNQFYMSSSISTNQNISEIDNLHCSIKKKKTELNSRKCSKKDCIMRVFW